jgi:hypothetical protein
MKAYKVTVLFTNLDNSLYTDFQAKVKYDIESDDYSHAYLLAQRLTKLLDADHFDIEEVQ